MYRKNVASQNLAFVLVNAATGAALTGATVTARRSIDGAAQANATGTVSELANGQYNLALSQADTNGNQIGILLTATSAIPVHFSLVMTAADPTNATNFGISALPNAAAAATGGLACLVAFGGTATAGGASTVTLPAPASTVADFYKGLEVSIVGGTGVGQSRICTTSSVGRVLTVDRAWATNPDNTSVIEVRDIAGPPLDTNLKVVGVVLTDTVTTYTGNTVQTGDNFARLGAPAGASISADIATKATSTALATVQSDTDDIQTRLPATLVSGRIDASVGAMAANTLTATAIATDAITAAKIATDAIGAAELAADAVAEIQSGLVTSGAIAAIQADTDDIQSRLPAALVGGRIDASVGALGVDSVNASALATSAVTEIWSAAVRTLTTAAVPLTTQPTAGAITQLRGDSWSIGFTALGSLTGASQIWFTVKTATTDADTAAIVQISQTVGLVRLNGAAGTAGQGSIVVVDAPTGAITVNLDEVASAQVAPGNYTYDVQSLNAGTITTHTLGTLTVTADVTRAVT